MSSRLSPNEKIVADHILASFGVTVRLTGRASAFYAENQEIQLNGAHGKRRLYILLHEAGHTIIWARRNTKKIQGRAGRGHNPCAAAAGLRKGSTVSNIGILEEEMEAWHIGRELAGQLGIALDNTFEKVKAEYLLGYVKWAANPKMWRDGK